MSELWDGTNTFEFHINEEGYSAGAGSLQGLLNLARLESHEGITLSLPATIVIGMIEGNRTDISHSSMTLWRYETNVNCTFESYPEE